MIDFRDNVQQRLRTYFVANGQVTVNANANEGGSGITFSFEKFDELLQAETPEAAFTSVFNGQAIDMGEEPEDNSVLYALSSFMIVMIIISLLALVHQKTDD